MKQKFYTVLTFLLIGAPAWAGSNGGYAGSFSRMGLGAQGLAMGNTGVAGSRNGFAAYYNPAGLSYLEDKYVSMTYYFLSMDRKFHYVGFALPLRPSAGIAVAWTHAGVSDIEGRSFTGRVDDTYSTGENAFILSFSNRFFQKFSVGISFKYLQHNLLEISGSGVGFDIGFLYQPFEPLFVGLQIKDFNAGYTWNTQDIFNEQGSNYTEKFPQILKLGIAWRCLANLLIAGDYEISDQADSRIHLGAEYTFKDLINIRAGLNHSNPTFGFGIAYDILPRVSSRLDYSSVFGVAGEGVTHVISWEFQL